jgi:hypothetical protein
VINTHGELDDTDSFISSSPCGIIFTTGIGKIFSTFTAIDDRLFHPVIDRVIEKTHIRINETKTGRDILSTLCSLREVPEHNWVGDKQAVIRGIVSECKFTGHKPGSLIPNNRLFMGGGTALVNEGVYMSLDDGRQLDVSSHFGLRKIPLQQPYKGQPSRSDPNNFIIKKNALYSLLRKNDKLSRLPKDSGIIGRKKRRRDAFANALKAYMFSIEGRVPVPKPYNFDGKRPGDHITLKDILGYASNTGFINKNDLIIISACRESTDTELIGDLTALIEMDPDNYINMGGNNNRKYKGKKSIKNKYYKSRKSGRRILFIKKTRRIIKRKYKK